MTSRILPPDEYPRLAGTEAEQVWPLLPPAARVVVVEDGGAIVGCHTLIPILHAECLWVAPSHRGKTSVARRLWARVQRVVREDFQADGFFTAADSDEVRTLLAHVGAIRIVGDTYTVPVRG